MSTGKMDLLFRTEDYVILGVTLLLSAGFGIYLSNVKHKQSSFTEYFLAGRNVNLALALLSYFSSFAGGGMTGYAIETYLFGAQPLVLVFSIPLIACFAHYLLVPVFYRLNNVSMLKYFEVRFGRTIYFITLLEMLFLMTTVGSINIHVASIAIQQVSALSVWVSASIITIVCIIYSSLGGMRGIILADSIQAVVMITALLFIFIISIIQSGGPKAIWDINNQHSRLQFFNMDPDPTIRHSFWSSLIGLGFFNLVQMATNQTLMQRCLTVSSLQSAQKMATIGSMMTYIYIFICQSLGVITFAYYKACHVVQNGSIEHINQLIPYFAMDILHQFPCLPGVYFSGILCASLSTTSSVLNSISAVIMTNVTEKHPNISDKTATLLCQVLVVVFGGVMTLGLIVATYFYNIAQAAYNLISVAAGPIFAVYSIGIFCPQANRKAAVASLVVATIFSLWIVIGSIVTSPVIIISSFSTNCTGTSFNQTSDTNQTTSRSNIDAYFPLSKVSYIYSCFEGFAVTIISFTAASVVFGIFKKTEEEEQAVSQLTLDLIPHCVRCLQLKMSRRMRRMLLCDVYGDANSEVEQRLMTRYLTEIK